MFFYQFVYLIQELLDDQENLKEFLYAGHMDFTFSELYLEAKSEFMMYHSKQISRTEKNINIQFDGNWTLLDNIFDYSLSIGDEKCPLRDPFRV